MAAEKIRVLCVGLVCVDIVNECEKFPYEDSDQRCKGLYWQRGGNASNNCTVLSQIGVDCEFLGVLSSDLELNFIKKDFLDHKICIKNCVLRSMSGKSFLDSFPVSTIIINSSNGSRTILHSKGDFPEVTFDHFKKLDLSPYSWIHFEGRNMGAVYSMMEHIKAWRSESSISCNFPTPCISVELEKPKPGLLPLAKNADVVFIGKEFAKFNGWSDMEVAIKGMTSHAKLGSVIVCTWGELGSCAVRLEEGSVMIEHSDVHSPGEVKDTLGAGDTFLAGFVKACLDRKSLKEALQFASKLAGAKVGMKGFSGIRDIYLGLENGGICFDLKFENRVDFICEPTLAYQNNIQLI